MEDLMEYFILIIFVLAGVIGTLMPFVPGTSIILAGAVLHAFMTGFDPITGKDLVILLILTLTGGIGQYVITGVGAKTMGSTKYGAIGAIVGFVVGLILPIPAGAFIGTFAGAFLAEMFISVKSFRECMKSGLGATLSAFFSLFFEFIIALVMVFIIAFKFMGE